MITLYNVISADGFIARKNGDEDFIPDEFWDEFVDLCKKYDAFVMGRNTFEAIQKYSIEQIKQLEDLDLKRIVVTNDPSFITSDKYTIVHSPEEALKHAANILISSGPTLNTSVLKLGLVDKVILNTLPEMIGEGIKAFQIEPNLIIEFVIDKGNGRKRFIYRVQK